MSLKFTFNPFTATFDSIQNLSGLNNRVLTLENNEYKVVYFTAIVTASGTITVPQGATILLDQFPNGVDAYVSQVDVNGQPTGLLPKTGLGVDVVVTSFDALGNYTLSGTPSSFPVALIYVFKIKGIDYSNINLNNELERVDIGVTPINRGGTNSDVALVNNRIMQSSGGAIVEAPAITANRALVSDANGIPTASSVTDTTLGFLDATSSVQTQLNNRIEKNIGATYTTNALTTMTAAEYAAATKNAQTLYFIV